MPTIKFARLVGELEVLYAPPLRQPATWCKLKQALAEFSRVAGVRSAADLTPANVARWLAEHPDRRPTTAHSLLRSLRAACSYATKMGYLGADPFDWRSPSEWLQLEPEDLEREDGFDRHLSAAEVIRLLEMLDREAADGTGEWAESRLRALVYTLAFTGMRKREALGLRCEDVDLPGRMIRLRSHARRRLKTRGSAAPLAMAADLAEVLALWTPRCGGVWLFPGLTRRGPWLYGGPGYRALDQVKSAGERAGIANLTMLSFRHTIGTLAEGWGVGELELQRWLRHRRRRTQDSYRKAGDLDAIRRTALKIVFKAS